jgi:FAD/FMN-containing dehydrogenase
MVDLLHPTESDPEDAPETPIDPGDFALAVIAEDQMEAQLLVSACEEAGIPVILQSKRSGPVGTIASPVDGFHILVPQKELERAQTVLQDRKRALEADPDGAALAAEEEEAETEPS